MSHPTKLPGKDHGLRHTGEMSRGVIRPVDGCFASVRIEHCSQGQRTSRQVEQSSKFRQGSPAVEEHPKGINIHLFRNCP
jgi:hypothetical protein